MDVRKIGVIAILVALLVGVCGCTSQQSQSVPHANVSVVNHSSKTASASVPTPSPTPTAQPTATWHNRNYHVIIHGQCVPAGCLMTDFYMWGVYAPHYKNNPRVSETETMKQCGPEYHTANCTASDVFVEVTVVETGQVAHFDVNTRDQVIPWVDTVLNAGYMA